MLNSKQANSSTIVNCTYSHFSTFYELNISYFENLNQIEKEINILIFINDGSTYERIINILIYTYV